MSEHSKIEWTEATWNPVLGCDRVSSGCANCYAVNSVWRMSHNPNPKIAAANAGLVMPKENGVLDWTGVMRCIPERLNIPLKWRQPRRIFVNSQSDLFHPNVPDDFIEKVFAVMAVCLEHTFQVLTKRPERMREFCCSIQNGKRSICRTAIDMWGGFIGGLLASHALAPGEDKLPPYRPLPNVWLGVSVESPDHLNRVDALRQTPAAVRFISYEPALAGIDWSGDLDGIDWVIVGGESGPHARRFHLDYARQTVNQCREAGVACFVKQLGSKPYDAVPVNGNPNVLDCGPIRLHDKKGGDWSEWAEDLRVREYPEAARQASV